MASIGLWSSLCPGHVAVALRGTWGICDATDAARSLWAAAASGSRIMVDLARLTFIDGSGVSALVSVQGKAGQAGCDPVLAARRQLQGALNSRVTIEQAKGKLAERRGLDLDQAFTMLRAYARDRNLRLSDLAQAFIEATPAEFPDLTTPASPRPDR